MSKRKQLRHIRLRRKLTQAQMAKRLGISRSHYSNLENGWRRIKSGQTSIRN
jgi:transcriptional regulator with XRE-family HTH domain